MAARRKLRGGHKSSNGNRECAITVQTNALKQNRATREFGAWETRVRARGGWALGTKGESQGGWALGTKGEESGRLEPGDRGRIPLYNNP